MKINLNKNQSAIYCCSGYGPSFGEDICVGNDAKSTLCNQSNLGDSYKHPQYAYRTSEAKTCLAGSDQFQLHEIEIIKENKNLI